MTVRSRLLPLAALLVAVATAVSISVALSGPAGAIVSATPNPGAGACETNGRVNAVAYLGGTIYLGGSFTSVEGSTRNRLAACDAATGNLLSWNPNANGVVRALKVSPAGTRVYVGGDFTAVGGAARARVAALNPTSGAAFGWSPYVNDSVKAITTSTTGSTVYVGGDFDSAEGAGRRRLAAFNATSGNISTTFKPTVSNGAGNFTTVLSLAVRPDNQTLYFSGDFALVNGTSRRNAAAVSTGVASLRAWNPASTADIAADIVVSSSGNTVFVGGRATGGYIQAYGPTTGGAPVWNVQTNGDVEALAVSSSILYVGGHFTTVGGTDRGHLAALSTAGGNLQSWAPTANGVFGAFGAAITSSRVAFGGEFTTVAGEAHQGIVQFSGTP
jgi:trimeric autotransporter adhesin